MVLQKHVVTLNPGKSLSFESNVINGPEYSELSVVAKVGDRDEKQNLGTKLMHNKTGRIKLFCDS